MIIAPKHSRPFAFSILLVRALALLVLALPACRSFAGGPEQAPVERAGFRNVTSYDSLKTFLENLSRHPNFSVVPIAVTREGRTVWLARVRAPRTERNVERLRVLLFAQQHGDEAAGKEALTMLLAKCASGQHADLLSRLDLLVVPQMNPDGAEHRRRRSGDGLDLNRTHLILTAPETAALHRVFLADWPEVTLDMHEYSSSESWSSAGFIKTGDVQLGMLTNLNSPPELKAYEHREVFPFIAQRMREQGFSFHEYIVGSPLDRIRHSTTEPNDGRQSFGLLGTLSFIQEGRKWGSVDSMLERRARAQLASVEALLEFCANHSAEIRAMVASARADLPHSAGKSFVLRMDHLPGGGTLQIPVHSTRTGRDTAWTVQPYHSEIRPLQTTSLPSGYVIPMEFAGLLLLEGHGIVREVLQRPTRLNVQIAWLDSVGFDVIEEDSVPHPFVRWVDTTLTYQPGDVVVRLDQRQALLIASALEPESLWGIGKYPEYQGLLARRVFPFARLR